MNAKHVVASAMFISAMVTTVGLWVWTELLTSTNAYRNRAQQFDEDAIPIAKSLKSNPKVNSVRAFCKIVPPHQCYACEIVYMSEDIINLNFAEDDIVHSLEGEVLAIELDFRIELAKGKQPYLRKGMQLDVEGLQSKYSPKQDVRINLVLKSQGADTISGHDPLFLIRWGGAKVPWQEKKVVESPADEVLKTIVAGKTREFTVNIAAPEQPGEYSLYAVFDLTAHESGVSPDDVSVYSDIEVLRVEE